MSIGLIKKIFLYGLLPITVLWLLVYGDLAYKIVGGVLIVSAILIGYYLRNKKNESENEIGFISNLSVKPGNTVVVIPKKRDLEEEETIEDNKQISEDKIPLPIEPELRQETKPIDVEVITDSNYYPPVNAPFKSEIDEHYKEKYNEIVSQAFPNDTDNWSKFSFFLEIILKIIADNFNAYTVMFFWFNKKKESISLAKYFSKSDSIVNGEYELETDILSKIVQKGEPEILGEINPAGEKDVLRYYSVVQNIRSFVGVPVFYNNTIVGMLALDSKERDAFGVETIYTLGRFVRLISMNIGLIDEKINETRQQQQLKSLQFMANHLINASNEIAFLSNLESSLRFASKFDAFALITFDQNRGVFTVSKTYQAVDFPFVKEGQEIDLNGTISAKSIYQGASVKIDELNEKVHKRFFVKEEPALSGSFLAIPLLYSERNLGVLCFESRKKNFFADSDVKFLQSIAGIISYVVFSYTTRDMVKEYVTLDLETNLLIGRHFLEKLDIEIKKAADLKLPSSLILLEIDKKNEQTVMFEINQSVLPAQVVANTITANLNHFGFAGRLNERKFGIYLVNCAGNEVITWANKLRRDIARAPVAGAVRESSLTASQGVYRVQAKDTAEKAMIEAVSALKMAVSQGGNRVNDKPGD